MAAAYSDSPSAAASADANGCKLEDMAYRNDQAQSAAQEDLHHYTHMQEVKHEPESEQKQQQDKDLSLRFFRGQCLAAGLLSDSDSSSTSCMSVSCFSSSRVPD